MDRFVNILYAIFCMVLYVGFIAFLSSGGMMEISNDALFIGLSIVVAGCLAYGGD